MSSSPRSFRRTAAAGVTLVELMIVLVVIAIGILALSGVQTRSSSDVYATGRRTRALAVAQTQMEVKRSLGYTGAVSDSGVTDGYTWAATVDTPSIDLARVRVSVSWTEKGTTDSLQIIDLISKR
jgi:prepilin-type N-terminal cleavage/methylation domain-containing protein